MSQPTATFPMSKMGTHAFSAPKTILALAAGIALIIATGTAAFYFVTVKAPSDLVHHAKEETIDAANRVATGFKSMFDFTPRITVNGTTVVEQATSLIELATVQQDLVVHYQWSQTWVGSTKGMELQGIYKAKAGFDLRDPFQISVDATRITAHLPKPKLLSLEMTGYKVLRDDNGWWNNITAADRENAINAMQAEARTKAAQSGLLAEAKLKFHREMENAIKGQKVNTPVQIDFQDDIPISASPREHVH